MTACMLSRAASSLPRSAALAAVKRPLVVLPMADRTTRGERCEAARTSSATRRMQAASATELPPNFITMPFMKRLLERRSNTTGTPENRGTRPFSGQVQRRAGRQALVKTRQRCRRTWQGPPAKVSPSAAPGRALPGRSCRTDPGLPGRSGSTDPGSIGSASVGWGRVPFGDLVMTTVPRGSVSPEGTRTTLPRHSTPSIRCGSRRDLAQTSKACGRCGADPSAILPFPSGSSGASPSPLVLMGTAPPSDVLRSHGNSGNASPLARPVGIKLLRSIGI